MSDNTDRILTTGFSSEATRQMYKAGWPDEPACRERCGEGAQCGACSCFAKFDSDWGLCCHPGSRHRLETVFEHFYCPAYMEETWGPHSFATSEVLRAGRGDGPRAPLPSPRREPRRIPDAAGSEAATVPRHQRKDRLPAAQARAIPPSVLFGGQACAGRSPAGYSS